LATGRLRTIPLVVAVAGVRFVQVTAVATLALTASGHGQPPNQLAHVAPPRDAPLKKTQAKKTHQQPKKTCDSCCLEEDPPEEDPTFRPADLLHFQIGGDSPAPEPNEICGSGLPQGRQQASETRRRSEEPARSEIEVDELLRGAPNKHQYQHDTCVGHSPNGKRHSPPPIDSCSLEEPGDERFGEDDASSDGYD
jgi:hypothetical protein